MVVAALRLAVTPTEELTEEQFAELDALCAAAFGHPFAEIWERVGPGVHVIGSVGGRAVAHAMIVDRSLYLGHEADQALDAGYVENVATLPGEQGKGYGGAVMREVNRLLDEDYALGALATNDNGFYERFHWRTWHGATWERNADGERVRTDDKDWHVMILRTRRTPSTLDIGGAIAVDWRPGGSW